MSKNHAVNQAVNQDAPSVVTQGDDRYVSKKFDSTLHHLLIQGAGIAGAALAVINAPILADLVGMKSGLVFTIATGAAGYLMGNLASQILMLIFSDLSKPFVPNSWVD